MGRRLNYSGLVVAGTGFFLTRFTVTLAIYEDPVRFYLAGVVPLVLGLGLAAFGVALVVADIERSLVRTTALWCVAGTGTMLLLVFLTLLGSTPGGMPDLGAVRSRTYLSNFLIGGSVGGTLTGLYAARDRRQQVTLRQQANRLEVLNRLLRHEVLNALTAIQGYAAMREDAEGKAQDVIEARIDAIEATIEEVKYLTKTAGTNAALIGPIELEPYLEQSVRTIEDRYPDADVSVGSVPDGLTVIANERIERVFVHLLENAVVHGSDGARGIEISVETTPTTARISVRDRGPGLPENQQKLLETGEIERFDDPGTGFGLNLVRFLVENYRGSIDADVGDDGTTVTVELPRAGTAGAGIRSSSSGLTGIGPVVPHLVVTIVAALISGVLFGVTAEAIGGSIGVIGVLYGVDNVVVGWITHEFHSVVFGLVFFGIVAKVHPRYRNRVLAYVTVAFTWSVVIWFIASGFVSPVWLRLLGIQSPLPSLSLVSLASHVVWGVSLGVLTGLGFEHVSPRLFWLEDRLGLDGRWSDGRG